MTGSPTITQEQYARSATPTAVAAFRERCRETARALEARGVRPDDLLVVERPTVVPRRTLGRPAKDEVRTRRIVGAHGWALHEVTTLLVADAGRRFQHRAVCVLAPDGRLLKAELRQEELRGVPTADDGRVMVSEAQDRDLAVWNRSAPWDPLDGARAEYLEEFPGSLQRGLDALLARA